MFFTSSARELLNSPSGDAMANDRAVSQIVQVMGRMAAAAALALAACAAVGARAEEPTSRDLSLRGEREMEAGDLTRALESFRAARETLGRERPVKEEIADFLALHIYNLGVRFNNTGDAARALDSFLEDLQLERLVRRLRDVPFREGLHQAVLTVAAYVAASGRPPKALEAYSLLEEIAGSDPRYGAAVAAGRGRIELAAAGTDVARLERALGWLRRARDLEPTSGARHRELAAALVRLGDAEAHAGKVYEADVAIAETERLLRASLSLEPDSAWSRIDLAGHLLRARRYGEAASLLAEAEARLHSWLASAPQDGDAESWRRALAGCREKRSVALYNLAVDSINRADFDKIEPWLSEVCTVSPAWAQTCSGLRQVAHAREEAFKQTVEAHEKALSADPARAADLLALGDLYANLGVWDRSLEYYRRLESLPSQTPGLADRIASVIDPGQPPERRKVIDVPGGAVELVYYRDAAVADLETALKAARLRVSASLSGEAVAGALRVTLYPNRRAFRERAGYRVGGLVKGNYAPGQVRFFETPSQSVLEWVSVLTHEVTHHAVERLSGGAAPHWLSEGVARYVEGETEVVDRRRLGRRLEAPGLPPLARLDDLMERSWNDPETYLDMRDEALMAVEEMARRRGAAALKEILTGLREPSADLSFTLQRTLGLTLEQVDQVWRASLRRDVNAPAP